MGEGGRMDCLVCVIAFVWAVMRERACGCREKRVGVDEVL